jgi:hypothetical protein
MEVGRLVRTLRTGLGRTYALLRPGIGAVEGHLHGEGHKAERSRNGGTGQCRLTTNMAFFFASPRAVVPGSSGSTAASPPADASAPAHELSASADPDGTACRSARIARTPARPTQRYRGHQSNKLNVTDRDTSRPVSRRAYTIP